MLLVHTSHNNITNVLCSSIVEANQGVPSSNSSSNKQSTTASRYYTTKHLEWVTIGMLYLKFIVMQHVNGLCEEQTSVVSL